MLVWCCWKWFNFDLGWYLKMCVFLVVFVCVCLGVEGVGRGGKGWLGVDWKVVLISRN